MLMNRRGKRLFRRLIPLGLLVIPATSDAAPGPAAPESTVTAYFQAVRVSDHDRMAALMHPQALDDVRGGHADEGTSGNGGGVEAGIAQMTDPIARADHRRAVTWGWSPARLGDERTRAASSQ
jgi:hypothetical protein